MKKSIFLFLLLSSLVSSQACLDSWWNESFNYRFEINCSYIDDGVPLVINGSNGFDIGIGKNIVWTYCKGVGTSLYYNSSNLSNYVVANESEQLPFEVENGNATSYNPIDVWDENYQGVWHLQDASLENTTKDSTVNSYNGSYDGTEVLDAIGKSSGAFNYSAIGNSGVLVGDKAGLEGMDTLTLEAWIWIEGVCDGNTGRPVIGKEGVYYLQALCAGADRNKLTYGHHTSGWASTPVTTVLNNETWYYIATTYNGSIGYMFIDGIPNVSVADTGSIDSNSELGGIGLMVAWGNAIWLGMLDEVRISNVSRSASVINQTYQNMIRTSGFGEIEESILCEVVPTTTTLPSQVYFYVYDYDYMSGVNNSQIRIYINSSQIGEGITDSLGFAIVYMENYSYGQTIIISHPDYLTLIDETNLSNNDSVTYLLQLIDGYRVITLQLEDSGMNYAICINGITDCYSSGTPIILTQKMDYQIILMQSQMNITLSTVGDIFTNVIEPMFVICILIISITGVVYVIKKKILK